MVYVFRWYIPHNKAYATAAEGEYPDSELVGRDWTEKTYLYDGYTTPGEGRVAVYGWVNPVKKAYVSVKEGEYTDEQMQKKGYSGKHVRFYLTVK